MKNFTVVCVCCCGCDQNEIHWVAARSADAAARKKLFNDKRVVAVFAGLKREQRTNE
jgi:formate dehydrogenase assembly factor FdhD